MTDRERLLRAALKRSMVALDDWLHLYAAEQCDPKRVVVSKNRVEAAQHRSWPQGTLAYIASVQAQNRKALKPAKPKRGRGGR